MFTAPDVARRGVGRAILRLRKTPPEPPARRARLGATLSGETSTASAGYVEIGRETALLPDGAPSK